MWVKIVVGSRVFSSSQTPTLPNTPGMANDGAFTVLFGDFIV